MGQSILRSLGSKVRALAKRQHGVVSREQLLEIGFNADAIQHRIETGRLFPVYRGVYSVGTPHLTRYGRWMAAVLACGPGAALSHDDAAALWQIRPKRSGGQIRVSVPGSVYRKRPGVVVHRRVGLEREVTECHGIPVTEPIHTLIALAPMVDLDELEAAINEADIRRLITIAELRPALDHIRAPGARTVRELVDRRTFTFSRSWLERRFRPIARRAGLSKPQTCVYVNGEEVDFYWPELGLVIETDGGTFHRTPSQQRKDRVRDQKHTMSGLTPLRFTHGQIRYEAAYVQETLAAVAGRLMRAQRSAA